MSDESSYQAAIAERQSDLQEKFLAALRETPIVEFACKRSGVGRSTFYRWRKESPTFAREYAAAHRYGVDFINDMSESQMIQLIKEKKLPAIALWLKHNSTRYGAKYQPQDRIASGPELSGAEMRIFRRALTLSGSLGYGTRTKQKRNRGDSR